VAHRYRFDEIEIDIQAFRLSKAGEAVQVEPKALNLLIFLVEHRGRLVDRREILSAVWKDAFVSDHVLNRAIGQLRKVLAEDVKEPRYIETVPTLGYRFIAQVEELPDQSGALPAATDTQQGIPIEQANLSGGDAAQLEAEVGQRRRLWQRRAIVPGVILFAFAGAAVVATFHWIHGRSMRLAQEESTRSLVVLPLENLSGDPSQDYLADGMTEELIGNLGRIGSLRVISRTTAMRYKKTNKSLQQIASELHVDDVIEGTVTRSGDHIRIAAQLFDGPSEKQLWTGEYDGEMRSVLEVQNHVATSVAEEIRVKLSPRERTQLTSARQVNPAAYEAFLKGNFFDQNTPESEQKALQYYQQAVQLDPAFARAYVGIARTYNFLASWGVVPAGQATAASDSAVAKALELDPSLGEAYGERAWTLMYFHWDFPGTERDFQHALELDPGEPYSHEGYGVYLVAMGQFEHGLKEIKQARDLDPLSVQINAQYCYLLEMSRHRTEAEAQCQVALELSPNYPFAVATATFIYLREGSYDKAAALMTKAGWDAASIAAGEEIEGVPGKAGAFEAWLKSQKDLDDPFDLAYAYAHLGKNDEAFRWLEKAYEARANTDSMVFLGVNPGFDKLHSDPRFDAFLRHAGLPPRPQPDPASVKPRGN
jgi:TolB-like protein/DNA-binding winged helix-turn-helix (wHTH) protein/Tfp pilus assembly protein PilF